MKRQLIAPAIGLFLVFAQGAMAEAAHERGPCITDQQFGPGPIVNGRHRQPTEREVEVRLQRLRELSSGACFADAPVSPPAREPRARQR